MMVPFEKRNIQQYVLSKGFPFNAVDVVVGYRRPSGAEGPYPALILGLCRSVQTNFGEFLFHNVHE